MQNGRLQQYVPTGRDPVCSDCLTPPLRFALLLCFRQTAAPNWNQPRAPGAGRPPRSQSISVFRKRCQESFLSLLEDLFKRCLVALTTVQFIGSLTFYVRKHLETLYMSVYSFSRDHRRKADFISRLTPTLWAVALPNNNKIIVRILKNKQIELICFLDLQVSFFLYLSLQFRKVRYISRSGVEQRARGGTEDTSLCGWMKRLQISWRSTRLQLQSVTTACPTRGGSAFRWGGGGGQWRHPLRTNVGKHGSNQNVSVSVSITLFSFKDDDVVMVGSIWVAQQSQLSLVSLN